MSSFKLDVPAFATEAEEADWWFENQDLISDLFVAKYGPPNPDFLALDVEGEDAQLIRERAAREGITPNLYATRVLHNALRREAA